MAKGDGSKVSDIITLYPWSVKLSISWAWLSSLLRMKATCFPQPHRAFTFIAVSYRYGYVINFMIGSQ
nr:MAG TPA: hypothetical protein [Caudoviricetes sp.]